LVEFSLDRNAIFLTRAFQLNSIPVVNFGLVTCHPINLELQDLWGEMSFLGFEG